jgi:transposase InsO family protein
VRRFERGEPAHEIAAALGIARSTVFKWIQRFRLEGEAGMADRTSRPDLMPTAMPEELKARVERLRRQRWTYARIAAAVGRSQAAVARVAQERGVARLDRLDPREPVIRYERAQPGELVHVDIKKLGRIERGVGHRITGDRTNRTNQRGVGYEFAHVCIDDASRVAYVEVLEDECADTATAFMERAVAWFADRGVRVEGIMTDNGSAYRSRTFRKLCGHMHIRHLRTRPYTPRTNGKAERFIQTALREWAYERPFASSAARLAMLGRWLHRYNWHRPHTALNGNAPMTRIPAGVLNLLGSHI